MLRFATANGRSGLRLQRHPPLQGCSVPSLCLLPHQESASRNRLSGTKSGPAPGAAGFRQGWTPPWHQHVHRYFWSQGEVARKVTFLCLLWSQAGFPEARIVVTSEQPLGLDFSHLVAWLSLAGLKPCGALVWVSPEPVGAGGTQVTASIPSWGRRALFQLRDARSRVSRQALETPRTAQPCP